MHNNVHLTSINGFVSILLHLSNFEQCTESLCFQAQALYLGFEHVTMLILSSYVLL